LELKVIHFFRKNISPSDDDIHNLAKNLKIEHSVLEAEIYKLLGSFLGEGKSKLFEGKYDKEQLKMGIKVEMEHTTNPLLAKKIAFDHLAEIPDYYTRLAKMEKEAGIED